ncbi:MAG: hypothetical protein ABL908_00020 [Hyphomicrobium sp.]
MRLPRRQWSSWTGAVIATVAIIVPFAICARPSHVAVAEPAAPTAPLAADKATTRIAASSTMRAGMAVIRKSVLSHHTLITHRRLAPADARRFAATLHAEATALKSGHGLAPAAAQAFEDLLEAVASAASAITASSSTDDQMSALARIEDALAQYPTLFHDPIWEPLR